MYSNMFKLYLRDYSPSNSFDVLSDRKKSDRTKKYITERVTLFSNHMIITPPGRSVTKPPPQSKSLILFVIQVNFGSFVAYSFTEFINCILWVVTPFFRTKNMSFYGSSSQRITRSIARIAVVMFEFWPVLRSLVRIPALMFKCWPVLRSLVRIPAVIFKCWPVLRSLVRIPAVMFKCWPVLRSLVRIPAVRFKCWPVLRSLFVFQL
jgi:hypothetical protein